MWVIDRAYIVDANTEYKLTQNAIKHERKTSNKLITVTVSSIRNMEIERFSSKIVNEWSIKLKDNDTLFLIAPKQNKVMIAPGSGLSDILTDKITADIIEHKITPYIQTNNHKIGIIEGHNSILEALNNNYSLHDKTLIRRIFDMFLFIVLLPFLIFKVFKNLNKVAKVHPAFRGGV